MLCKKFCLVTQILLQQELKYPSLLLTSLKAENLQLCYLFVCITVVANLRCFTGNLEYMCRKPEKLKSPFRRLLKPEIAFAWTEDIQKAFAVSKAEFIRRELLSVR